MSTYRLSPMVIANYDVRSCTSATAALVSGTMFLTAIDLPLGFPVTNLHWLSGTTPQTLGTTPHYWTALLDKSRNVLGQSTDNVAKAIAASTVISDALSSVFTTTYGGSHYIGIMVVSGGGAGVQPTMTVFSGLTAIMGLATVDLAKINGSSTVSQTVTATTPATAITQLSTIPLVGVS